MEKRRWLVVIGALLVQLSLGALYAWGAFTKVLQYPEGTFAFSATQAQAIFSTALAFIAATMIFAGRWQDRIGPRKVALTGGVTVGISYLLAGLVGGNNFFLLLIFIGVIGGIGTGLSYVCPIAACVKWFPDLKGIVTGLAVASCGFGAWLFVKLAGGWGDLINVHGVSGTFIIFGIVLLALFIPGAMLLSAPPAGWVPAGWKPKESVSKARAAEEFTQAECIRKSQFWMLWFAFVCSVGTGLMITGCLKNFGEYECFLSPLKAGSILGLFAIFNSLGRIGWGALAQNFGARKLFGAMAFIQAAMLLSLHSLGRSELSITLAACLIGLNFGGNFTLFPLIVSELFGTKNLGANYGILFTAYGAGGIVMPILAGRVYDLMGSHFLAFIIAGIGCFVAASLVLVIKPPSHKTEWKKTLELEAEPA